MQSKEKTCENKPLSAACAPAGAADVTAAEHASRFSVVSILVFDRAGAEKVNAILAAYGEYVIGRMGIPYHEKQMSIISVVMDAPQEKVSALSGKLGMIPGVSSKCLYAPDTQKAPK